MDPIFKPRLPTFGAEDGQQVLTSSGNIFEFNAEKNEWVCIGIMPSQDLVSLENDGLVPPELYRKLTLVQELIDQGFDFSSFKLDTDVQNPYYYLFHSSDDLIKFSPEKSISPKELRVITTVAEVADNGDGTSTIGITTDIGEVDYAGFALETLYCNYNIISNTDVRLIIDADKVNILPGDQVKIIKPEEMTTKLRIEIDKGRLYQKLVRNCCVGPKGLKGDQGDQGSSGDPAGNEVFELPLSVTDNVFAWESIVDTPIDTPISLRIFRQDNDDNAIIEVLHSLGATSPSMVIINDATIVVEETPFETSYDATSKVFSGSLVVSQGGEDIGTWRYKVRQQGPKGPKGADGNAFLEVVTNLLEDPSIRSTEAIVSLRRGTVDGDIIIFNNTLFDQVPVSNIAAVSGQPISNISEDEFVAVNVTIDEAKDIGFYKFAPKAFVVPPLDIPLWTPTADCVQTRRWAQYRFDWFNKTEPDYLYSILLNPRPPEQCCQEDFFFCPNVGDNPCGITGEILPPVPSPVDCYCICENPIGNEFLGGGIKVFHPMDLTSEEASLTGESSGESESGGLDENTQEALSTISLDNFAIVPEGGSENLLNAGEIEAIQLTTVESVIDGVENTFVQDIKLVGNGEIIIALDYDADPCGGPVIERQDCAFVDSNAVRSFITLTDRSGTSVISGDGVVETPTIPTSVAFTVTGQSQEIPVDEEAIRAKCLPGEEAEIIPGERCVIADLQLKISVNVTNVNYCRGYRVTILALSDKSPVGSELDPSGSYISPPIVTKRTMLEMNGGLQLGTTGGGVDPDTPQCKDIEISAFAGQATPVMLMPVNESQWAYGGMITYQIGPTVSLRGPTNGAITGTAPNLIYASDPNFVGVDSFQYTVSSTANPRESMVCTVTINVVSTIPEDSFTGDNFVINGGGFTDIINTANVLLDTANYVQQWPVSLTAMNGTGGDSLFVQWQDTDIGYLLKAPSPIQTPLVHDGLQDNIVIYTSGITFNKIDSGYDNGPLGIGTYVLGNNFTTTWSSRIPATDIRQDTWTDVIVFFNEPQTPSEPFQMVILARLSSSVLIDTASSTYANDLFNSGVDDGVLVYSGTLNNDSMAIIKGGSITFSENGSITIGYQHEGVDVLYPDIVIEPVEPVEPPIVLPPGISEFVVSSTNSQAGGESDYTFSFFINNSLPPDGQICILFPDGFDIDTINAICSETIDGGFTATKDGNLLKIRRDGYGMTINGETTIDITVKNATNTDIPGDYFIEISTTTTDGVIIDGPAFSDTSFAITSGEPDSGTSMVELIPSSGIEANGVDTSMVVVTVRDAFGNLVEGATVTLSSSEGSDIITQPAFTTDANGEATGNIAATSAGSRTITATVNGSVVIDDQPTLSFVSGTPVDAGSMVSISPSMITADNSDSVTITVMVVDALMNPVEGATVTLSASGTGNTITQPVSPTNSLGKTTGSLVTTDIGNKVISAVVDGSLNLTDTAIVAAVSGPPSDTTSMVSTFPTSGVAADGVEFTTVTVFIYDGFGNPVSGEPVALFATGSNNTFTPQMGVTDASGMFESEYTTTTAEFKEITVLSDTLGFLSDTATITFDSGGPDDAMSTVTAFPTSGVDSDGVDSSLVTVTVLDAGGNPVSGESVSVSASPGAGVVFSPPSGSTNGSGVFTSTMTSTSSGIKTVSANLFGSIGILSDTANVEFTAGPAVLNFSGTYFNQSSSAIPSTAYGVGAVANEADTVMINDFTFSGSWPNDGQMIFDFSEHTNIDLSMATASGSFFDGGLTVSVMGGDTLIVERDGTGTPYSGFFFLDLFDIVSGDPGTYKVTVTIADNGGTPLASSIDSPDVDWSSGVLVDSLLYGGFWYPADQFFLAFPDACLFDHWHGGTVRSDSKPLGGIGGPDASDPDPFVCGFGTKVPMPPGVIADLGTPDAGGLTESSRLWPSAEKAKFDAFMAPWV